MSSFCFENIQSIDDKSILHDGFYIWVWHADKIPPHIGCSLNGLYFSLKVNGKDSALNYKKVIQLIDLKRIPTLFIHVLHEIEPVNLKRKFDDFQCAQSTSNTCLSPITSVLSCESTVFQLADLLKYLNDRKELGTVFGLNLGDGYSCLPEYTIEDIDNRLRKLENAKSEKHISPIG